MTNKLYNIIYQPLKGKTVNDIGRQQLQLTLNDDQLMGIIIMTSHLVPLNQLLITVNNIKLPINKIITYHSLNNELYTCLIDLILVSFQSLDFLQGAITACNWYGIDWKKKINQIKCQSLPIKVNSDINLGKILVNSGQNMIDLLTQPRRQSLSKTFEQCFNNTLYGIGFLPPSITYVITTDSNYNNIVATASISKQGMPLKYQGDNSYYIFNVATQINYRGRGYMKFILAAMINDINRLSPSAIFYLQVDPHNIAAIKLYQSFGFTTIDLFNGNLVMRHF